MQGKIALEEHFAIPTLEDSHGYFPDRVWQEVKSRSWIFMSAGCARWTQTASS